MIRLFVLAPFLFACSTPQVVTEYKTVEKTIEVPAQIPPELLTPLRRCDLNQVVTWGDSLKMAQLCRAEVLQANCRFLELQEKELPDNCRLSGDSLFW